VRESTNKTQASILDRLIDEEPEISTEPVQSRFANVRQFTAQVRRDIENLLNTKNCAWLTDCEYQELRNSLYFYGLPDFTAQNPGSSLATDRLRQEIERAIARFEPRMRNVMVVAEVGEKGERTVGFKITGLLMVEPAPEPVSFDTRFDANRGEYKVVG
jgi:type VI secretion system protein ImpF